MQHRAVRAGLRFEGEPAEFRVIDTEQLSDGVEHARGVQGRDEREEGAARIRESSHRARGVGGHGFGDGEDGAARADRHDDVTGVSAKPEPGSSVVAGSDTDHERSSGSRLVWREDHRQNDAARVPPKGQGQKGTVVFVRS